MGGQSRYKVPMFDHQWRVLFADLPKDELIFGSDEFALALPEYDKAVKANPGRLIQLCQRSRIVRRSDED